MLSHLVSIAGRPLPRKFRGNGIIRNLSDHALGRDQMATLRKALSIDGVCKKLVVVREESELREAVADRSSCVADRFAGEDVEGRSEADGRKIQYGRGGVSELSTND